ncbi:MAG: hypothetical protein IJX77_09135 [Ruminococcus sp.]|nr:hypothetical protein [Ruminococcus sp.]
MKKLLSLASALVLCSAMPINAFAESAIDTFVYDFNGDGVFNWYDCHAVLEFYTYTGVEDLILNDDGTYTLSDKCDLSETEIESILKYGNITDPEGLDEDDIIDSIDAGLFMEILSEQYSVGDLNTDNAIDALDASLALEHYAAIQSGNVDAEYMDSLERANAHLFGDFNGDGNVNSLDASDILAHYANAQTALAE